MEVPALCSLLLMSVCVLLAAQTEESTQRNDSDAVFPVVVPNRLQFFEYDSFSVRCEEVDGLKTWRVKRKLYKESSSEECSSPATSCTIKMPLEKDSGEYWCETDEGRTSDAVNISVTDGSVILEIPARPVTEGSDVTLTCKNKNSESHHISDFYKDGVRLMTGYENNMIIQNISKFDEGRYKCNISGKGESPESWLAVVKTKKGPSDLPTTLILLSVSLVALLLVLIGLILYRKHKVWNNNKVTEPLHTTYAVMETTRSVKGEDNHGCVVYAVAQKKKKEPERSTAVIQLPEDSYYSLID